MMRSLFSGVSGMRNNQTRMDVSGNNIANVNTVGFKSGRVTFQDVLSQTSQGASAPSGTRGGTNPRQVGLGVGIASIDTMFTDGSFQPTGKATDLSIQGQGFFVLGEGSNQFYTRAGNFDFDTLGNFGVPGTGYLVQGWTADANGVIDSAAPIKGIKIPVGQTIPAKVTDSITNANNLSASAKVGDTALATIDIYDSLGTAHTAKTTYVKIADNKWLANTVISDVNGATTNALKELTFDSAGKLDTTTGIKTVNNASLKDLTTGPAALTLPDLNLDSKSAIGTVVRVTVPFTDGTDAVRFLNVTATKTSASAANATDPGSWTIAYEENGKALGSGAVTTVAGTPTKAAYPALTIDGSPITPTVTTSGIVSTAGNSLVAPYTTAGGNSAIAFTPNGGATAMSVELELSKLTQYGGDTSLQATTQSGYAAGTMNSQSIDVNGNVVGGFTNGQTRTLAKLALATFNNPAGLTKVGSSLFAKSTNSGEPQVGTTGVGGRGTINPGTLEMSNVDLAEEFSNMIITQRGFQANSRVITTTDTMLEELINLKR